MNSRPEITAMLSSLIQRHICPNNDTRIYWAREVTFDYGTTNAVRVDFMKFKPVNNTVSGIEKGDFYCSRSSPQWRIFIAKTATTSSEILIIM